MTFFSINGDFEFIAYADYISILCVGDDPQKMVTRGRNTLYVVFALVGHLQLKC